MRTLITGHARSATGYFSQLMQAAGLDIGHEIPGRDGVSSWLHIAPGGSVPWLGSVASVAFDRLVHVVRNPLHVIASAQTIDDAAWDYMEKTLGKALPENLIERAMLTWVEWNRLVEKSIPTVRVRIEDVERRWPEIMQAIDHNAVFPDVPAGYNSRPHGMLTWLDLEAANDGLAADVRIMAERYGYTTEDRRTVTISACMIVKNEEKNLPRCLDSIGNLVDEIVVVDTGSTDRTVQIAESYGARIFHSPWRDDFSFHRNESMEHATGDWILRIDADEELFLDCLVDELREQLTGIPDHINATRNIMEDVQGGQARAIFPQHHFFRRGRVMFKNRKHNRPVFNGPVYHLRGVTTRHYGYDKGQTAGKKDRDLRLLMKMREEDPGNDQVLLWLSQLYSHYNRDFKTALDYCMQYIQSPGGPERKGFDKSVFVRAYEMANEIGDREKAAEILTVGFKHDPESLDLNFIKVREGAQAGNADIIEDGCREYLRAFEQIRRHPETMDGRFVFYSGNDALIYVLHKAAVCHLHRGVAYLGKFHEYAKLATPEAAEKMTECMLIDLNRIGYNPAPPNYEAA